MLEQCPIHGPSDDSAPDPCPGEVRRHAQPMSTEEWREPVAEKAPFFVPGEPL